MPSKTAVVQVEGGGHRQDMPRNLDPSELGDRLEMEGRVREEHEITRLPLSDRRHYPCVRATRVAPEEDYV